MLVIERGDGRGEALVGGLLGRRVIGANYVQLEEGGGQFENEKFGEVVHEVDMGILVDFGGACLYVTWVNDGTSEGVCLDRKPGQDYFHPSVSIVNVADMARWSVVAGVPVSSFGFGWQRLGYSERDTLWSLRMDFEEVDRSIVIALGNIEGGLLKYHPDALAVIFDDEVSKSYIIPAGTTSSWGLD